MTPAVSVVMATWNRPQFLRPAIASVLNQSFDDFELIIVDDGSAAPTRELLGGLRHPALRLLWRAHSGLPAVARNAGLQAAQGRYVAFIDSDDLWLPDKLLRQVGSLARQPAFRWGYTACAHIGARQQAIEPAGIAAWRAHTGSMRVAVACLRAHSALPTVIAERELLLSVGGFDESLPLFEDHDLWLRLAMRSEADVIPEPLVQVRRHDEHYSGHDPLLEAQCRLRFLDKAWVAFDERSRPGELRRLRALAAARLARLCAARGRRDEAARTLRASLRDGCRHPRWWRDALASFIAPEARSPR